MRSDKISLDDAIYEIGQAVVSIGKKVAEHNTGIARALEDITSLAGVCYEFRQRIEALEASVRSMRPLLADLVVAWDPEAAKKLTKKVIAMHNELGILRRDMMNRTDPRNFEIDPRSI